MTLRPDSWATDDPELARWQARRNADTSAWHCWNELGRLLAKIQATLADPNLGEEWRGQLRSRLLEAGSLAVGSEE